MFALLTQVIDTLVPRLWVFSWFPVLITCCWDQVCLSFITPTCCAGVAQSGARWVGLFKASGLSDCRGAAVCSSGSSSFSRLLVAAVQSLCGVSCFCGRLVAEIGLPGVHEGKKKSKSLQNRGHLEGFQKLLFLAARSSVTPSHLACSSHQKRVSVRFTCETTSNGSLVRFQSWVVENWT